MFQKNNIIGENNMILKGENITEMNTRVECEDKEKWKFRKV